MDLYTKHNAVCNIKLIFYHRNPRHPKGEARIESIMSLTSKSNRTHTTFDSPLKSTWTPPEHKILDESRTVADSLVGEWRCAYVLSCLQKLSSCNSQTRFDDVWTKNHNWGCCCTVLSCIQNSETHHPFGTTSKHNGKKYSRHKCSSMFLVLQSVISSSSASCIAPQLLMFIWCTCLMLLLYLHVLPFNGCYQITFVAVHRYRAQISAMIQCDSKILSMMKQQSLKHTELLQSTVHARMPAYAAYDLKEQGK